MILAGLRMLRARPDHRVSSLAALGGAAAVAIAGAIVWGPLALLIGLVIGLGVGALGTLLGQIFVPRGPKPAPWTVTGNNP